MGELQNKVPDGSPTRGHQMPSSADKIESLYLCLMIQEKTNYMTVTLHIDHMLI